jgi:ribonucleoside-triphosphate reductase (thioredoxin)
MSIKALSDYTIYSRYSKYIPEKKRRETWPETVDRVFDMHGVKYKDQLESNPELVELVEFAKEHVRKKAVLGSQRALQFGGAPILKHNDKMYNCATTYIDRFKSFQDIMYLLLCGCGVGFSVQHHHIEKLPAFGQWTNANYKWEVETISIDDSIEGWADSIGQCIGQYLEGNKWSGKVIKFDYSQIRPAGSLIANAFKAPGPDGLRAAHEKIKALIEQKQSDGQKRLKPIDVYDIIMHASDAVLSGGVRRSATICVFSPDDDDMVKAKTGNWFIDNPQRGRSNNSALLIRNETTKEQFETLMESVKQFGEPGFVWTDDRDILFNPCVEISFYPQTSKGESGIQFCNLTEINGRKCKDVSDFLSACKASAIIGTMQAGYHDFPYLGDITEQIVRREALLGCSITGLMDSPDILFDEKILRQGAKLIKKVNKQVAEMIGINPAARTTCIKPAGSTSCVLGTASGIHPHHARRYIRRVQANKLEFPVQKFIEVNPLAVEESVWSQNKTDMVVSFLCEVPVGAITKNQIAALDLLGKVKLCQQNWIEYGTNEELSVRPYLRHNVSNTITVKPDEWDDVTRYIYNNRNWFAGISLLPASGDKDYPQAPFTTIYTPQEIVKEYGDASLLASGLIVDGLKVFNNNLWDACNVILLEQKHNDEQADWIRRSKQFAERYFNNDVRKMTYCLKDVANWKLWCDLSRTYQEIDWSTVCEEFEDFVNVTDTTAVACQGNQCEIA